LEVALSVALSARIPGGIAVNEKLKSLLDDVAAGRVSTDAALSELRHLPYEDLGFAKIDHHRELRDLLPEVILGQGKTPEQIAAIGERLAERSGHLLVTRLDPEGFRALKAAVPDAEYHELARVATLERNPRPLLPGIGVVCAGTSDLPVAQEAVLTARMMGHEASLTSDVGVAGIHRLFDHLPRLLECAAERCRRSCCRARRRRPHVDWLRRQLRRARPAAFDAQQLCRRRLGRQHR
jgi:NCAIR mutase (PurE)-related protein